MFFPRNFEYLCTIIWTLCLIVIFLKILTSKFQDHTAVSRLTTFNLLVYKNKTSKLNCRNLMFTCMYKILPFTLIVTKKGVIAAIVGLAL